MDSCPTVIDLFCGAGGLSEGFRQAGFQVLLGSDIDPTFGTTFAKSHHGALFVAKPIQALTSAEIMSATGLGKGQLDVLVGGPPCQGYSVYNHGRGEHDPRAGLFREYLRLVRELAPKWLVMENVTGLLSISGGQLIKTIAEEFSKLGYCVQWRVLRAEDYGVPQERRRVVFIANRVGASIEFPKIEYGAGKLPYTSIWDAISDLPLLGASTGVDYATAPSTPFQARMRKGNPRLSNHVGPKLGKANLERIRHIPQGGSWRDIPFDLLPEGMKRAKRSDHTKRYGRPRLTDLSCTILTKCDIHWGAYIHPVENRAFTVREAARLQSFPDDFVFYGSMTEQFVQVGNAVPPMLAHSIASAIIDSDKAIERIAA
ncbi:DNA cytosine methyltransferase [Novosphingobium sp.]|uniref:DNA cytosine methyltransferase n=1 Tax=Novosphingobium sp. TaxID=1874826 RepID=UPI0027354200|nr:DNA cytosine methyltransferase [Novosphingobium sp.]MDP3907118.1 DNA cytosine methyltransferase [Novosphingobium sp.]